MAHNSQREPKPVPPPTIPDVTDADVTAAQAAAKEAMDLIGELEDRVISGDDTVTPEEIAARESLGRFARLRAAATLRKAATAKEAARLRDCQILHDEMTAYAVGDGTRLAELYQAIFDAREAFQSVLEERNQIVASWYRRAKALDIAQDDGRPTPKTTDGLVSLGRSNSEVRTESTVFSLEGVARYLGSYESPVLFGAEQVQGIIAALRKIDTPDMRVSAEFIYRGESGGIIARDRPFTDEELSWMPVRRVTAEEAWPE